MLGTSYADQVGGSLRTRGAAITGAGADCNSRLLRHFYVNASFTVKQLSRIKYGAGSSRLESRAVFSGSIHCDRAIKVSAAGCSARDSFRAQMKQALHAAEQDALARGYKIDDIRRVIFAVVAFLDESVLSCRHPAFADWPVSRYRPSCNNQLAGETFFQELQKVLTRADSPEVADVLEVFYLCLLLGFQGRYAAGGRGDLHSIMISIRERCAAFVARVQLFPLEVEYPPMRYALFNLTSW